MMRVLRLLCPLVASVLLAAAASAQTADPGIEKLRADYEQAWKKGGANALAALYAEDAVSVNAEGIVTRGRAGIEKALSDMLAGPLKGSTMAIASGATQVIAADVALSEGTYTISGAVGPDGKPMTIKGHYVNTLLKKGSGWLIAGNAAFVPQPPPPAPKAATGKTD